MTARSRGMMVLWIVATQALLAQKTQEPKPYTDPDAYEVYSALVLRTSRYYVIEQDIQGSEFSTVEDPCLSERFRRECRDLLKNFDNANRRPLLLLRKFKLDGPYELLSIDEVRSVFKEGGWKAFYGPFPKSGGLISVSAVGFNKNKTRAFVYLVYQCGTACHYSSYRLLEKREGVWKEVEIPGGTWSLKVDTRDAAMSGGAAVKVC